MLDKSLKKKADRMCKIAIRNAGKKQDDIARVLNVSQRGVSRPLIEHWESGNIRKGNNIHWWLSAGNCYWSIMVHGALSDDHLIQLKVVTETLNAQKYQDEILESGVRSPLDSLDGQKIKLWDDIARPHCTRIIEEYKNQQNIAYQSLLPDLNPIEHVWVKLRWCVWNHEPAVSNHCEFC